MDYLQKQNSLFFIFYFKKNLRVFNFWNLPIQFLSVEAQKHNANKKRFHVEIETVSLRVPVVSSKYFWLCFVRKIKEKTNNNNNNIFYIVSPGPFEVNAIAKGRIYTRVLHKTQISVGRLVCFTGGRGRNNVYKHI